MDMSLVLNTFVDESRDLLAQMEDILLRAESGDTVDEDLHALFRCAHTIKGSAGLFGLDPVVHFTHGVESVLDRLRCGRLDFSPDLVSLLLECQDFIAGLIAAVAAGDPPAAAGGEALRSRLQALLGEPAELPPSAPVPEAPAGPVEPVGGGPGSHHWHLSLRFGPDILKSGMDPLTFIRYLNNLGTVEHVETVAMALPGLAALEPESCYLGFEVGLRSDASKADLEGVFDFLLEDARITILPPLSRVEDFVALIDSLHEDHMLLGEMLVACGSLTRKELDEVLAAQHGAPGQPLLGELLTEKRLVQSAVVEAALSKQKRSEEKRAAEARNVKVPAERLDALINQVGELVIAGAAAQLQARQANNRALQEAAANLLRLVEDIRDTALSLRMTPIGEVFGRFPRVVRDVSRELGKAIELKISGADTELDKSMVEKIGDPLMHLVRNAMDHGIEAREIRAAAGKPEGGTVRLNAYHESGSIVIEVSDDGGGLDPERIFRKAVERGLVPADASLSQAEIFSLILEPGFSTAEKVTNLSGRGVGMDVVKSSVEALRGTLDIDSALGRGTTMRICLPLTLAIIDGFQVGVGPSIFILPLDAVEECIELPGVAGDYLNLRGEVLPFLRLRGLFGLEGRVPPRQNVVVVRFGGRRAGIVVDRLYGECQAVIKPLSRLFERAAGISGSTILGSGEVALILDVLHLVQHAEAEEGRRAAG